MAFLSGSICVVPSLHVCSEGSMLRRFYIPKVLCSEDSMFRRFYVPKFLCSEGYMLRIGTTDH